MHIEQLVLETKEISLSLHGHSQNETSTRGLILCFTQKTKTKQNNEINPKQKRTLCFSPNNDYSAACLQVVLKYYDEFQFHIIIDFTLWQT